MDLVIACDAANKESSLCRQACEATHREYIQGIGQVYAVFVADSTDAGAAIEQVVNIAGLTSPFIFTNDTTFLTASYDPSQPCHRQRFAVRKGEAIDRMVNTISYLLEHGYPTFDYELNAPIVVDMEKARHIVALGSRYHFRTMYGNTTHATGVRVPDFHIDPWVHSMEPAGPVVSVGPTALRHLKCLQWVRKLRNTCLSSVPTAPVP